jgi:uncharacterized protein YjbI with pentapeptide repeats
METFDISKHLFIIDSQATFGFLLKTSFVFYFFVFILFLILTPEEYLNNYLLNIKRLVKWLLWEFSGARCIYEKIYPPLTNNNKIENRSYRKAPTFALWVIAIWSTLYSLAAQKYQGETNTLNSLTLSISQQATIKKDALALIPKLQSLNCPKKPDIINPLSMMKTLSNDNYSIYKEYPKMVDSLCDLITTNKNNLNKLRIENINLQNCKGLQSSNFEESDLSNSHLNDNRLSGSNFKKTKISSVNFRKSMLFFCNFEDSFTQELNYNEDRLSQAINFDYDDLQKPKMKITNKETGHVFFISPEAEKEIDVVIAQGPFFTEAFLRLSNFKNSELNFADFRGADLTFASFENAQLQRADIRNSKMYECNINGADLLGADLRGAMGINPQNLCSAKSLEGAKLDDDFRSYVLDNCIQKYLGKDDIKKYLRNRFLFQIYPQLENKFFDSLFERTIK